MGFEFSSRALQGSGIEVTMPEDVEVYVDEGGSWADLVVNGEGGDQNERKFVGVATYHDHMQDRDGEVTVRALHLYGISPSAAEVSIDCVDNVNEGLADWFSSEGQEPKQLV